MADYKKPAQTEEELAQEIKEQFLLAKRYLDPIHERMNNQEELYRTYIDKNNYPHNARVFDPRVFRVIETVTPRMVANEPTGSFYPTEQGDIMTSQILNALNKYDWRRAEMFPKLVNFVKCMLIFGTSFGRTYWDFRETEKQRMAPKKLNDRLVWTPKNTEMVRVTEFDGPNFEVLNIYDCFPDPNATTIQNARWFIYRIFKTLDELEAENDARGAEHWKNLDKLKKIIEAKKATKNTTGERPQDIQYREHRRVMLSTEELIGEDQSNPEIAILVRLTKDGWCFFVPEYASESWSGIIREVDNPYFHGELPIVYGVDYPYPGELYGMGEIEPVDRIQRAINAVLNQRLDNVQLNLRTMWKAKKNSGVDMHTLVSTPGNIITTDDMEAVEPIQVPDVTGTTFVETMNYLTAALQNGTGITDYTMGVDDTSHTKNETATGVRLIQQEANAQFKLKIQLFNHMVIQRIANQWKDLRVQYTTEAQKLRIIGAEDVNYMRENTQLTQTAMDGTPIFPGQTDMQAKLEISPDENFAFLNLMPEDIQPAIVGDYDFIASVSQDQLNDPIAMQQNFFLATDRITQPQFIQGLAQQGKMPNYEVIAQKTYKNLNLGLEDKDLVTNLPQVPQIDPMTGQPIQQGQPMGLDQMNQALAQPQMEQEAMKQMVEANLQPQQPQQPPIQQQGGPNGQAGAY